MNNPDFTKRSRKEEMLDASDIDKNELYKNLDELETINRLLGGHRATLLGLANLIKSNEKIYRIVDFACGGGDTLRTIEKWAIKNNLKVDLIGFDILPDAIEYAKSRSINSKIKFICTDFKDYNPTTTPDICISSLVCHHLYDEDLRFFLFKMKENSKIGFIINDLRRHWFAYYSIKILTSIFSTSKLVKNDACLSVLKGFKDSEWATTLDKSGIKNFSLTRVWAFRHLITFKH